MFYKGINLSEIIYDINTGFYWSSSRRAYELFGKHLTRFTEVKTDIDWITLATSEKYVNEVYMIINVEWSKEDWIKAKNLASREIEIVELGKKKESFIASGILSDEQEIELKQKQKFLKWLLDSKGMLTKACRKAQIPMQQYRSWMQSDADFVQAVTEVRDTIMDSVEEKLIESAEEGYMPAISYFLDARGKDRGYGKTTGDKEQESSELDLSLLTYQEQEQLQILLIKAQPKSKQVLQLK